MIVLVKLPAPVPSVVVESAMVGAPVVFQQTPLAVTAAPPSNETSPPLNALFEIIVVAAVVVKVGMVGAEVKEISFP